MSNKRATGTQITITNIMSFVKNKKHEGDFFLITDDKLKFWVKDPEKILLQSRSNIRSITGVMSGEFDEVRNKYAQFLVITSIDWEEAIRAEKTPEGKIKYISERPDYTGWTDEQIASDIFARRQLEEKLNGNSFVDFRERVVAGQLERHHKLIKNIRDLKKGKDVPAFDDIDPDPNYMRDLTKEATALENKLGRDTAFGDGTGRLTPGSNVTANGLTWGMPPQNI